MKDYGNLSLQEIDERIEQNNITLDKFWHEDDGGSWENYKRKCQPYWDDNSALYASRSLKLDKSEICMEPFSDLDKECCVSIEEFTKWCKFGYVCSYDGVGYYATDTEVSNLNASPSAFRAGIIRKDFTHVCWYNK